MIISKIKIDSLNTDLLFKKYNIFIVEPAKFEKNKDELFYSSCIIDSLELQNQDFYILSVVYSKNGFCLVLMENKDTYEVKFHDYLTSNFKDFSTRKVLKTQFGDEEFRKKYFEKKDRLLLKLIVGALKSCNQSYQNLTGNLYYNIPGQIIKQKGKIIGLRLLQIDITPDMNLSLNLRTFRLKSPEFDKKKYTEYVIDNVTNQLRRALKSDSKIKERYIRKAFKKKGRLDFLSIQSIKAFLKSKMGILSEFIIDFEDKYSELIKISFEEQKATKYELPEQLKGFENKSQAVILNKLGINIVNKVKDYPQANELISEIKKGIEECSITNVSFSDDISEEKANIVLIHGAEYYESKKCKDIYPEIHSASIVQAITVDTTGNKMFVDVFEEDIDEPELSAQLLAHKAILELCIKYEINIKKLLISDVSKILKTPYTFVLPENIEIDDNSQKTVFYRLKINPSGTFTYDIFEDSLTMDFEKLDIITKYRKITSEFNNGESLEGFVYKESNNITSIIKTSLFSMPEITNIRNVLQKTSKSNIVQKEIVQKALNDFSKEYKDENITSWISDFSEKLSDLPSEITYKELNKILNVRKAAGSCFNRYFNEHFNILINAEIKSSDFEALYNWNSVLDIEYYKENESYYYLAGKDRNGQTSFNKSLPTSCVIRRVVGEETNLFEEILPLFQVSFVRPNSNTVLPFPFKYLREIRKTEILKQIRETK